MRTHPLKSMASGPLKIKKGLVLYLYWPLTVALLKMYSVCDKQTATHSKHLLQKKISFLDPVNMVGPVLPGTGDSLLVTFISVNPVEGDYQG